MGVLISALSEIRPFTLSDLTCSLLQEFSYYNFIPLTYFEIFNFAVFFRTTAMAGMMSPSILRRADAAKKSLSVKFEDSVPFDLKSVLQEADQGNTGPYDELCQEIAKGIMQVNLGV